MTIDIENSAQRLWAQFIKHYPEYQNHAQPVPWCFCDNEKDADACAVLVLKRIKQATSTSLWWYETYEEPLPKLGDLNIITDWKGMAKAVIRTTKVELKPYNTITEAYAAIEGEGDKSLAYWKSVHWAYYTREMAKESAAPSQDMVIVCEQFETLWTTNH